MKNFARRSACVNAALLGTVLISCPPRSNPQTSITLVATGSSLPEPLYVLWADEYHKRHPETQLRYLPEGTEESANRILSGTGDFGGGDAPIPKEQLKDASHPIIELPAVLIGIAIVYNFPGAQAGLHLSGPVLANIYLGKITSWNDSEIVKLNPDAKLPALPIKVVHRSEGKGSSYIFSDFLSKVSPEFQAKIGRSVSPKWAVGDSFGRTQDLLDNVEKTRGAIGYTELNWAEKSGLPVARIRNAAGEFIRPSVKSIADAASALAGKMTDDFRVSLTNAPGKDSYPISSFTWLYVPAAASDAQRGRAVAEYLKWVFSSGQDVAGAQGYATLPASVLARVQAKAATVH
ncbi:MAG TPA: phosphate ABC transporter substrate-binding protein PstS [Candidatus Methylomirabilis sp.]|nr:phosphate ABC transporter substrate-binding protein PstS [Candidatus Methylomirabilis sp.]